MWASEQLSRPDSKKDKWLKYLGEQMIKGHCPFFAPAVALGCFFGVRSRQRGE
jgi:hypothetical protein